MWLGYMRINRMTEYALRIIRAISESPTELITSEEIAARENLTPGIILKIMRVLRKEGVVCSHRGRGKIAGGFTLNMPLDQITLLFIIELMEGQIEMNPNSDTLRKCCEHSLCSLHKELNSLTIQFRDELSQCTLKSMLSS